MKYYFIFLISMPYFLFNISYGQSKTGFTAKNLSYYYYPGAEIKLDYNVSRNGNHALVYLNINSLEGIILKDNYILSYELKKDYQTEEPLLSDTIPYQSIVFQNKNQFVFHLDLNLPMAAELLLVHVANQHNKMTYSFDIPLQNEFIFPRANLVIKKDGLPLFNKYITERDSIEFSMLGGNNNNENIFAYYYNTDFSAADPPMAIQTQRVKENMDIDRIIPLPLDGKSHLDQQGLYFIQKDTNTNIGLSVMVEDIFYPRLAQIDDVTGPLIYITTRAERERLTRSTDRKKEMDRFWLNLTKSPDNARNLIRNYYQRVRQANYHFTGYKEGWKTDQGMIFILFGPPDEVYRDEEKEEWVYQKVEDLPKLSFSFMKVKNIFTDNHYVLVRSKEYERHWYRIVDMWRKGRFSNIQAN
jgi:GWxTD domain-containing protein